MFEDETYDAILARMLSRIPNDIEKGVGEVIWDVMASAAKEVAQVYHLMGIMYRLIFGQTTDGDLLDLRAADFGVFRELATASIRKGIFKDANGQLMDVPLNSRFSIDSFIYIAAERVSDGNYLMRAETLGESGDRPFGQMLSTEIIDDLGVAELAEVLVPGQEKQTNESLLEALQEKVSKTAASGNEYEYEVWAKEVSGVHSAKAYGQWNGPNTVKVVLMDSEGRSPSPLVIQQVKDHIKSVRPVGSNVTVVGVTERIIGVTAELTLQSNGDINTAKTSINILISAYFKAIAGVEDTVRYTAIGNSLLDGVGVLDYANLMVNSGTANIAMGTDDVPVLGTLTLTI